MITLRWPWETRAVETVTTDAGGSSGNVTEDVLDTLTNQLAGGGNAEVAKTAAAEFAVGVLSRGFALADVHPAVPAVSPGLLAMVARQVLLHGNAVLAIDLTQVAEIELTPAARYEMTGGTRPSSWRYQVNLDSPDGMIEVRDIGGAGVVHYRIGATFAKPWHGVSPLVNAGFTAGQLANMERRLQQEANARVGYLLPVPDATPTKRVQKIRDDLGKIAGNIAITETTSRGFGQGRLAAPAGDWDVKRFGPNIPPSNIVLRDSAALAVMGDLGVPPALYAGDGGALREAYRQLLTGGILPLANLLAAELSEKFEFDVRFTFRRLAAADIAARARAYGTLIQANMSPERAGVVSGIEE